MSFSSAGGGGFESFELPQNYPETRKKEDPDRFVCKYGLFDLASPSHLRELEEITTDVQNTLSNPHYEKKKWLLWEKSFLSGESAMVALKYVILDEKSKSSKKDSRPESGSEEPPKEAKSSEIKGRRRQRKAAQTASD